MAADRVSPSDSLSVALNSSFGVGMQGTSRWARATSRVGLGRPPIAAPSSRVFVVAANLKTTNLGLMRVSREHYSMTRFLLPSLRRSLVSFGIATILVIQFEPPGGF